MSVAGRGEKIGEFTLGPSENGHLNVVPSREDLERCLTISLRSKMGTAYKLVAVESDPKDTTEPKAVEYYAEPPIESWMTAYEIGDAATREFDRKDVEKNAAPEEIGTFSRTQNPRN